MNSQRFRIYNLQMKSFNAQKNQRPVKPRVDDPHLMGSSKYATLRFNKENDRHEEIHYLNKHSTDSSELIRKVKYLDINSPKGNATKPRVLQQQAQNIQPPHPHLTFANHHQEQKQERAARSKRQEQFADVRDRIAQLQSKLEGLKNYLKKKSQTSQGTKDVDERKQKATISKSRSFEKLPLKPIETENIAPAPTLKMPSSTTSSIPSFVTQVAQPTQSIQCSSYTNLSFMTKLKPTTHKYYVSSILSAFCDKIKTSFTQLCKTHLTNSLQLLSALKSAQRPVKVEPLRALPPTNKKTIVFDLDETLIHCNESADQPSDEKLSISFPTGQVVKVGINVRPWAKECLKELSEWFQIIIFTASHECYGNVVADYLDPSGKIIAARYFRDSCHRTSDGFYVKDLRVVDRPLENMLLIDNAAYSYAFQIENGVPIIPFYNNKTDTELRHLVTFLKGLVGAEEITKEMCEQLKVNEYSKFDDPEQLIRKLYAAQIK